MTLKDQIKDLLEFGEFYNDLDLFASILRFFEKDYNLAEKESNLIYQKISKCYYNKPNTTDNDYDSDLSLPNSDDSDGTKKEKTKNKVNGKQLETKKCKHIESHNLVELVKKLKPNNKKNFGLTGPVGVGKTAVGSLFAKFLARRGHVVQQPEEISMI
ncbi:hypothetical protein F8M41_013823 [Gigaspora margarita]|uniref:Uncharacterized protein n=1 Tax=Gigaspora margarita TaxID=4874 RepID=A0A8H3WWM2_GIGMA|nr:hypothetical protein F8M41_013823 [Gigaspora margarita]